MTIRINFLPKNYQPPKQMSSREWGVAAAVAAVVLGAGIYYTSAYAGTISLEQTTQENKATLQGVQSLLAEAESIRGREERVARAEADLKALTGRHWSGVLLTLRELTPQHVTWTSVKADGDDIVLQGTSKGLIDVAQLLGGLITDSSVDRVALKYVNEEGTEITFTAKQGEQQQPNAEPIKPLTITQLEFEMTITLVPSEGRQVPHGA